MRFLLLTAPAEGATKDIWDQSRKRVTLMLPSGDLRGVWEGACVRVCVRQESLSAAKLPLQAPTRSCDVAEASVACP